MIPLDTTNTTVHTIYLRKRQACMRNVPPLPELHKVSFASPASPSPLAVLAVMLRWQQASSIKHRELSPPAPAQTAVVNAAALLHPASASGLASTGGDGAHPDVSTAPGPPPSTRLASPPTTPPPPSPCLGLNRREILGKAHKAIISIPRSFHHHISSSHPARIQPHRRLRRRRRRQSPVCRSFRLRNLQFRQAPRYM